MLPFTYYDYEKKNEEKNKDNSDSSNGPDPFEKSKALGVGSLLTASHEELYEKFISKHCQRSKKPDYKKENEALGGQARSYILPRDSWNILDGPSLVKH